MGETALTNGTIWIVNVTSGAKRQLTFDTPSNRRSGLDHPNAFVELLVGAMGVDRLESCPGLPFPACWLP
jgi:hypothetical protein